MGIFTVESERARMAQENAVQPAVIVPLPTEKPPIVPSASISAAIAAAKAKRK